MALLNGKELSLIVRRQVKNQVPGFIEKWGRTPVLDVVMVGEDPGSKIYVRDKSKACKKAGITSHTHQLQADTSAEEVLTLVDWANANSAQMTGAARAASLK